MGLFDIFTGDSASKAAEENRGNLSSLLTKGTDIYGQGYNTANTALNNALGGYQSLSDLAGQYGQGTQMYLNALGLNGQAGSDAARASFQTSPGYQFNLDQGLEAINRRRAAGGMFNSGNADVDAQRFGAGLASSEWNPWLSNLSGLNSNALTATNAAAAGQAGIYGSQANLAQQNAGNLVGLNTTVTNGINSQNTQEANAKTAASGNIFNFGMNLAKLGAGL
jgi:hypothetical protein